MYVCAIWLVWLEIPQVQMDGCSLVPNCFSLGFGFESLTQSNFCIFVSRCFGIRCKGRGQVGGEDSGGTCELNNYCKQWSISDRSERGAVHQMDRISSACQEKPHEKGKEKRKIGKIRRRRRRDMILIEYMKAWNEHLIWNFILSSHQSFVRIENQIGLFYNSLSQFR